MNENNQFDFLDGLTIIGFLTQLQNIQKDEQYINFIKHVIAFLIQEIEKLHKENDEIMAKLDILLRKENNNGKI